MRITEYPELETTHKDHPSPCPDPLTSFLIERPLAGANDHKSPKFTPSEQGLPGLTHCGVPAALHGKLTIPKGLLALQHHSWVRTEASAAPPSPCGSGIPSSSPPEKHQGTGFSVTQSITHPRKAPSGLSNS